MVPETRSGYARLLLLEIPSFQSNPHQSEFARAKAVVYLRTRIGARPDAPERLHAFPARAHPFFGGQVGSGGKPICYLSLLSTQSAGRGVRGLHHHTDSRNTQSTVALNRIYTKIKKPHSDRFSEWDNKKIARFRHTTFSNSIISDWLKMSIRKTALRASTQRMV